MTPSLTDKDALEAASGGAMTYTEHLDELRTRLLRMLAAVAAGMLLSYIYIDSLVAFFTAPAERLYYLRPAEAFFIYLKVGLVCGLVFASPVAFYELWAFVMPAFTLRQRLRLTLIAIASVLLFGAGLAFGHRFILPLGLRFFMGFDSATVQSMISMESYVDFVLTAVLPFGFVAELPLVLSLAACLGLVSSSLLVRGRRYVIFGIFTFAAIATPPDAVSQLLLAVPMLLLYEIGLLFIRYVLKK